MPDIAGSPNQSATVLNTHALPCHIGIIMDGNGRWAAARNKPRSYGHREGLEASKRVVRAAAKLGIKWLSLYTFSTENWKRTEEEVSFLMGLLQRHLRDEYDFYRENQIRLVHSGDLERLPPEVQKEIRNATRDTADFTGLTVNLAINYGGRDELIRAFRRMNTPESRLCDQPQAITETEINAFLDIPDLPDADLIIRTGGEQRISNFLLWKSAYAELYFSDRLWPDWDEGDLVTSLEEFQKRNRRFGGIQ